MRDDLGDRFGRCWCRGTPQWLNVGPDHFLVCRRHHTKWYVGSDLYPSWRSEGIATWAFNEAFLGRCREIQPHRPLEAAG